MRAHCGSPECYNSADKLLSTWRSRPPIFYFPTPSDFAPRASFSRQRPPTSAVEGPRGMSAKNYQFNWARAVVVKVTRL